jgi:hypothetical protein
MYVTMHARLPAATSPQSQPMHLMYVPTCQYAVAPPIFPPKTFPEKIEPYTNMSINVFILFHSMTPISFSGCNGMNLTLVSMAHCVHLRANEFWHTSS